MKTRHRLYTKIGEIGTMAGAIVTAGFGIEALLDGVVTTEELFNTVVAYALTSTFHKVYDIGFKKISSRSRQYNSQPKL